MERLTDKHYTGDGYYMKCSGRLRCEDNCGECDQLDEVIDRLGAYEDTGLEPEEIREVQAAMAPIPFGRFRDIMEAERAGRLVVLPCKVGDTVWRIKRSFEEWPDESEPFIEASVFLRQDLPNFGRSVFLTREEAERVLGGK